jgi:hypothetical protein
VELVFRMDAAGSSTNTVSTTANEPDPNTANN